MFKALLITLITVAGALPAAAAAPPAALPLDRVLDAVRAHDPELTSARAAARSADGMALMKRAWMPPRLGLEAMGLNDGSLGPGNALSRRWTLRQELPFPGRTWGAARVADHEAEAMAADAAMAETAALADAREAWYALAGALRFRAGLARVEAAEHEMAELSASRGRFGQLDRMGQFMDSMLSMEDAEVDSMKPLADQEIRAQRARLATLMGRADGADLGDPDLDLDAWLAKPLPAREAVLAAVDAANPGLRARRAQADAARAAESLAWSGWLPDLMVQGGLSEDAMGGREGSAMLELSLPYVWGWGQAGAVRAAAAKAEAARAGLEAERLRVREQAATALDRLASLTEALRVTWTRSYPNAARGLQQARSGFRTTALGPSEILMAVTDYRMTEEKLARLIADRGRAEAMLEMLSAGGLRAAAKEEKP